MENQIIIDSLLNRLEFIKHIATIKQKNLQSNSKRNEIKKLRKKHESTLVDYNLVIEKIKAENEKIIALGTKKTMSNNLNFLRPIIKNDTVPSGWNLLVVIKNDSLYCLTHTLDFEQFDWFHPQGDEDTKIGRPKRGMGEYYLSAINESTRFNELITDKLDEGAIILIKLCSDSINAYPLIRDFILRNSKRISIGVFEGKAEIYFSETGWSPSPIY